MTQDKAHPTPPAVPSERCKGCNGNGEVGGLRSDGYHGEECPFCKGTGIEALATPSSLPAAQAVEEAEGARSFPTNTCPASRHAQQMAEAMVSGEPYPMMEEERAYCGESILSVVTSLYKARTRIAELEALAGGAEK